MIRQILLTLTILATACKPSTQSQRGPTVEINRAGNAMPATPGAPPVARPFSTGVTVHLQKNFEGSSIVSFGLPLPKNVRPSSLRFRANGVDVAGVKTKALLPDLAPTGEERGARSLLVQLPATVLVDGEANIQIDWNGGAAGVSTEFVPYTAVRHETTEQAEVAERWIEKSGGSYTLVTAPTTTKQLFTAFEPSVLVTFPPGYLSITTIFGGVMSAGELLAKPALNGVTYLSSNLAKFSLGAQYREGYPMKPEAVFDPKAKFESWLYDRCATFLLAYVHLGDVYDLRHAYRSCSYYASKIGLTGEGRGIFTGKQDRDTKYSHIRGLYEYYALTGDESAKTAGEAIAEMWLADELFAVPYRKGGARGSDKLWTERLLGVSLEAMIYGYFFTAETKYLTAFQELFATAYRHITTTNQAELDTITRVHFPPQSCFVHSAEQHAEGNGEPWCSGWMTELLIDPLLCYQDLTNDPRVDEVFVRLARSLRDAGSCYFDSNLLNDSFLAPSKCFDPSNQEDPRILVPLYGYGTQVDGQRRPQGEWDDFEHCADATALTAAAIRALKRQNRFNGPGVGPFKTEGESFIALHEEYSFCARKTFKYWSRTKRDPRNWNGDELARGYSGGDRVAQNKWLEKEHIGYAVHDTSPPRKLSWWFNTSLLQFRLLDEAGVNMQTIRAGTMNPPGCPK